MSFCRFVYMFLCFFNKNNFPCTIFNTTIANEKNMYTIVFRNIRKPSKHHDVNAFMVWLQNQKFKRKRTDFNYVWIWYND